MLRYRLAVACRDGLLLSLLCRRRWVVVGWWRRGEGQGGQGGIAWLAGNDAYQTVQGTPITINATDGVLRNDFGVTDFPLSAVLDSAPPNGTFTFAADGSFTTKPKGNFVGLDSFTYYVTEAGALLTNSAIARVWITVTAKK